MSFLRGSQNYVWSTTSVLGKGATGAVYQGVNKINGEPVAVKTFNQMSHLRPHDVQMREFEVLQKVKHENIVKLLAIEEEQENRGKVIVMELCTGGSLFNILDDPENTYGLSENEFLKVLQDLSAGMKHLRDNNLVHRDLKPGNIMKFICDDGRTVYKLTDFGAARELPEGQHFQSLYGTEEYLHPDLYERAVLRKHVNKTFGATIDLWSIGVTLYHVATGNLPFRPYGGRKNKETMHLITTKKASGVISGIQVTEDGQIEWRKTLPESCQLSPGLKKIITPLLAGLLEADTKKIWTFEKFFTEVTDMLSRKIVNIFHVNKAQLIKVYIHPDESYTHLQNYINEQTEVSTENQILLLKSNLFTDIVEENSRAGGYPETKEEEPLFLFNKENNNVTVVPEQSLPKFNEFSNVTSVESDAAQAKNACSIGYLCKRRIEKYSLACRHFTNCVENFVMYINKELKEVNQVCVHLLEKTTIHKKTAHFLESSQRLASFKLNNVPQITYVDELKQLSESFVSETAKKIMQLNQSHVIENSLQSEWDTSSRPLKCPVKSRASERARTEVERLRDSWQHLVRDRATRTLSYNDEQFHILERIKITHTINGSKLLLQKEVFPQYMQLAENLGDWYKIAQTVYLQLMILKRDVLNYDNNLKKFELEMFIKNEEFLEQVRKLLEQDATDNSSKKMKNSNNQKLKMCLTEYRRENGQINDLISENAQIVEQVNRILDELTVEED
ncbi:serine/threonine-protein kinase TBK1-like [Zophobas morio]|uniref:serine/threonine-protein kinase TBK1-like n=1 Tax=Zophobas morio TaxID=2755281 RepID=UPI00308393FF